MNMCFRDQYQGDIAAFLEPILLKFYIQHDTYNKQLLDKYTFCPSALMENVSKTPGTGSLTAETKIKVKWQVLYQY